MYNLPVKIEKIEKQRRSNGLIHAIAGFYLFITAFTLYQKLKVDILICLPLFLVGLASVAYAVFKKKIENKSAANAVLRIFQSLSFLSLGLLFSSLGNTAMAIGLIGWGVISFFLYRQEKNIYQTRGIVVEETGVRVPGSPSDHVIPWKEIKAFTARKDFVTISRHDNKYVQLEISEDVDGSVLGKANRFAEEKIHAAVVTL